MIDKAKKIKIQSPIAGASRFSGRATEIFDWLARRGK